MLFRYKIIIEEVFFVAFIECKFKSKYTGGETDIIVILPVANGKNFLVVKRYMILKVNLKHYTYFMV